MPDSCVSVSVGRRTRRRRVSQKRPIPCCWKVRLMQTHAPHAGSGPIHPCYWPPPQHGGRRPFALLPRAARVLLPLPSGEEVLLPRMESSEEGCERRSSREAGGGSCACTPVLAVAPRRDQEVRCLPWLGLRSVLESHRLLRTLRSELHADVESDGPPTPPRKRHDDDPLPASPHRKRYGPGEPCTPKMTPFGVLL